MHCFTCVNSFSCVLNELSFWADISGEHVIFVKDLAHCNNVKLPEDINSALSDIGSAFTSLNERVKDMKRIGTYMPGQYIMEIRGLIDKSMFYDRYAIDIYYKVMKLGEGGRVFQIFLNHTIREQQLMYQVISNIKMQVGG